MLSYRHGYHAGNHADVFKHWVLVQLIRALTQKDKPLFVMETHAGAGRYDLQSEMALKNGEFRDGIGRLWGKMPEGPSFLDYSAALKSSNPAEILRWYPGSPRILRFFLRPSDRLLLSESHPRDHLRLAREFEGDAKVRVEHLDGYSLLKAVLPPKERRGLIHIDPSYERKDEVVRLVEALKAGYRRFATGVYAVWYPLIGGGAGSDLPRRIEKAGLSKVLKAEIRLGCRDPRGLQGSGMILINPPYPVETILAEDLPRLAARLKTDGPPSIELRWLNP